jgi:hypothetical protein
MEMNFVGTGDRVDECLLGKGDKIGDNEDL